MSRVLITSALPYINGVKHLGNLVGSMLPADVYARFQRQLGHEVLYICATDEHGTPAELAALEEGLPVDEYCRQQHELQAEIYRNYGLSFDWFGRSSSPQNHELTRHLCARLDEHGLVEERLMQQVYSNADGRYPARPLHRRHLSALRLRGGARRPVRELHPGARPHRPGRRRARRYRARPISRCARPAICSFCLPRLQERVAEWVESRQGWSTLVASIARKWLTEGLRDRCITRDLDWGVAVDRPGFEDKVFYVWFDAPIEYIAATREWAEPTAARSRGATGARWWDDPADVRYIQFMAKDNVPFHTVTFPATLLGSGEPWKMVDIIKGFNWLTYYGGKFSTSRRRGVFMDQALDKLPADYWRYWLIANAPESDDTDFTFELFAGGCNKDLADTFGNFVNRCLKFAASRFDGVVPEGGEPGAEETALVAELDTRIAAYREHLERIEFRKALAELRAIWALGNEYLQHAAPWQAIKTDRDRAAVIVRTSVRLIRLFAILAWPVIPESAARVLAALGEPEGMPPWPMGGAAGELAMLERGRPLGDPGILFRKLPPEEVAALEDEFRGAD